MATVTDRFTQKSSAVTAAVATVFSGALPRCLIVGNSISGLSHQSQYAQSGTTSYTTAATGVAAGQTSITLTGSGPSVGDKLGIQCYDTSVFYTTAATGTTGTTLVLASPLPKMLRPTTTIIKYVTTRPAVQYLLGPALAALQMLGMPWEIQEGYGYGGSTSDAILLDLPALLQLKRPQYVIGHLFENDASTGRTLAQMQKSARAFCKLVTGYGAVPILCTCLPSSFVNTALLVTAYDGLYNYLKTTLPALFPQAIIVDMTNPAVGSWMDTAAAGYIANTSRPPLAGWTDGVHPNNPHMYSTALPLYNALKSLTTPSTYLDLAVNVNPEMAGTGGTATNTVAGYSVSAGWGITNSNVNNTVTATKTAADAQRIQFTNAALTDGTSSFTYSQTYTFPANSGGVTNAGGANSAKAGFRMKINAATGMSNLNVDLIYSTGERHFGSNNSTSFTDPAIVGKTVVFETPPHVIPEGATTANMRVSFIATSGVAIAGVNCDVEIVGGFFVPAPIL